MRLLVFISLFPACLAPAFAMNWEGHDDWMDSMEPAVILEQAVPHASPKPRQLCPPLAAARTENPYEQIPLARQDCPVIPETPKHLR
jgi:hypothetical protein